MFAVAGKGRRDGEGSRRALKAALVRASAWAAASALVVGGIAVVGSPAVAPTSGTSTPHVMVVMMENKNFTDVIGKSDQPFTNSLASRYGLATQSYAFGHPSLPNYLTIVSGSNQGVTDDNDPSSHSFPAVRTIADQLAAAGFTARAYAENLPGEPRHELGRVRRPPRPLGVLPQHRHRSERRIHHGGGSQRGEPARLRLVHAQPHQRRARRHGAAGRRLPVVVHPEGPRHRLVPDRVAR